MSTGFVDRIRKPEYTGENRCVPCTAVNVAIAVVGSIALGWLLAVSGLGTPLASVLGAVAFVASLAAIYLRGYLVPGTPTFTKRYFPDWLLAKFDKHEAPSSPADEDGHEDEGAPDTFAPKTETVLTDGGAVDECENMDDLCLTDDFRERWEAAMDDIREEGSERRVLADVLGVDEESLVFEEHGDAFDARVDGQRVGQWESRAALIADLAAASQLSSRYGRWEDLSAARQGEVLYGLRVFLDECPECGEPVVPGTETVQSCCRQIEVVAMSCENCGARLLESELPAS